jgi:protein-S-isoprenylcysteine O-methyltransferase Ste14
LVASSVASPKSFPPSATHPLVAVCGMLAFFAVVAVLHAQLLPFDLAQSSLFIMLSVGAVLLLSDWLGRRYLGLASAAPSYVQGPFAWRRSFIKLAGFIGTVVIIGLCYWSFPEYHGNFYNNFYEMLYLLLPGVALLALPYIVWTDRRMADPYDGYWHMGKLVLLQWKTVDFRVLRQHWLGWTIKAFFLPLMFIYLCNSLEGFLHSDYSALSHFRTTYDFLYNFCYFLDVALCSIGYMFALRLADTHIRSAEPTMSGWIVALVCYQPFYSLIQSQYITSNSDYTWGDWLANDPVLFTLWGIAILLLTMVYVWATIMFGARFSNLTHRGIITSGPYRFTKHPAYIAKNLSWWMISVPFLATENAAENFRQCAMLLMLNGIYYLRAKTEERHLLNDPVYAAYVQSIEQFGLFRFLRRPTRWISRRFK